MLRDMDSKDFGFHHTFTANDQLGLFPEDQILPDKRFGNDLHKGYGQHNGYPSHSAVDHNWGNNIESYSNKPLQGQHYNSNNGRQDHGYYGGNQTDTFSQYGAPYGSNHRPEAGRGLLPHKDSMNPYFQHSGYQHDQMQHKIPARPAQGHMPMHSGYQQAPPPPQMMHNPPMGRPMGGRGYMPPPPQGQMMHNAYGMNGGNNMGMRPGMPPNNNVMMGMPMGYHGPAGSNAQGRAINKMLLEILRERIIDPQRLDMTIDTYVDRMDCVNLATLLFHTGKKRLLLAPVHIKRVAGRFVALKEELRAREASNALYGLKCMTSEVPEVRELVYAIATKVTATNTDFVAQAVGNALYGLQMMTSEYEEVRYLLTVLAVKVSRCTELLEAQNVGNALYGLRNMSSDYREVRTIIAALTPRIATAREDLNGQALGNSLYGLQSMSSKESEVRFLLTVLATKVTRTWEDLKAQEVGNALYGLKRMSTDVPEVRMLISALVPKVAASPEILDAQAIGNSFYGMQNMRSDNPEVLSLLAVMADKVSMSCPELDGQAMGNSLYGLQGMSSDHPEVRAVVAALTAKIQASCLDMNAQELGNALYGLQNMTSEHADVRRLLTALTHKVNSSKHDLTSQEIGNAIFGLQGMSSSVWETRMLVRQIAIKIQQSHSVIDPLGVANSLFGLQRMSSESEDVRLLVQALAIKIEHSWKLLTAQHVANALFGLQGLSSVESEVRYLIKALVPKVASCRDELNARQLSQALFGLRSFSSEQAEVLGLVAVLADKVTASAEPWTMTQLGMALFGLQGLSSNKEEVAMLLGALAQKAANLVAERHTDPNALANGIFGLQRMNTNCVEVCHLLTALSTKMTTLAPSVTVNARMCANTIFGLQAMSCANETVKGMLYTLADWMQQVSSAFMAAPHLPGSNELYGLDKTGQAIAPADRMDDILCLYQATALSLFAMRDLDADADLQARMYAELSALRSIVDIYKIELPVPTLTAAEKRMTRELADMLAQEPFNVITAVTAHGFEMSCIVQLYQGLQLKTAAGELWTPVLNLEVRGSSYSFPCKELYARLRKHYLEHDVGIAVDTVPADSFRIEGQQGLRIHSAVLSPLYPPTMEDAANFAGRLNAMSKSGQLGTTSSPGGFFSFSGASTVEHSPLSLHVGSMPPLEYYDDDFKPAPTSQYGDNKKYKFNASPRGQKVPLGMPLGWVGEWPMPSPHPVHQAGTSPATSPTGASAVRAGEDRGALNLNVQGSGNSLLGSLNAGSAPVGGLAPSQQFALGSGTRTSYQSELNAHSPPSPSVATRHMTKPVGYRGPEEDSDSSQSTRQRSLHQRSAQSSGNLEPFVSTIGPSQESRAPGGLQLTGNSPLLIPPLKVDTFQQQHGQSSTSASSDLAVTPVSHQPTIVLGFQHHTPLASHGCTGSGTSLLSTARTEQERAEVTVHQELSQSPVEEEVVGDVTEMDDEIAALEAQLEVARLEARIRELKSKKSVKTPHSAETESL